MSAPAPDDPGRPGMPNERRSSFTKYVRKMKTMIRRGSSKKDIPTVAGPSGTPRPIEETPVSQPAVTEPTATVSAPTTQPIAEAEQETTTPALGFTIYPRSAIQQERARALFQKYGLVFETPDWLQAPPLLDNLPERVEKTARMRVRRTCHRCETTFGLDRTCRSCQHSRCKKCPRYPVRKAKEKAEGGKEPVTRRSSGKDRSDDDGDAPRPPRRKSKQAEPPSSLQHPAGGEASTRQQPAKMRIHRHCHKCKAEFLPPTATVCGSCSHVRCRKCPRDPPKKKKWPAGYPGDVAGSGSDSDEQQHQGMWITRVPRVRRVYRKPRLRVRWTCEKCEALFVGGAKVCGGCGHERCRGCVRDPPKKVKKEFDPDVVRSLEARLEQLRLGRREQSSATGT